MTVGTEDVRCRWQRILYTITVWLLLSHNLELTGAKLILPVKRSFSQLEGSGLHEGAGGMTKEHFRKLKDHDFQRSQRHQRRLSAVADFPLDGNEYYVGLYYTELGLGTPPQRYFVQVDTGSDLLWVNCKPCVRCPRESNLNIPLNLYDPQGTSTGKNISCMSSDCRTLASISSSQCVDRSCYYAFGYGDGSTTMGYLVEDVLTFSTIVGNNTVKNATANIVFGCGFNQTGTSLTTSDRAVDGIMGFGRQVLSVVSQLADGDFTTNEFAHCLQGDTGHGGLFVVGDIQETGLVYTPMVANQFHYNVNLQRISVGDTMLDIDPDVFAVTSDGGGGTIFDSGTTLALLADKAFDAFVNQLLAVVSVPYITIADTTCFEHSSRDVSSVFPSVTLYFEGGAQMQLKPENYLYRQQVSVSSQWCLAWSSSSSSGLDLSILGDIVLKNKLVVYDIENEQIGWMDFNCQSSVKVSGGNGSGSQEVSPGLVNISSGFSPSVAASLLLPMVYLTVALLSISFRTFT
ncbi:hypothetical protein R1sor_006973 [Riccia sorocarpa]|uniref:Peptidase A1 domain-containing protein n=1 Tax=Riccia sorocarpa TaxID=122646 RepID=A0ABD3HS12_9MARC